MASTHASLDAAATERKARLAKLKSLKRKQPSSPRSLSPSGSPSSSEHPSVTTTFLSGRNYDPLTRGPKLGFEAAPSASLETLEDRATQIADTTTRQAEEEEKEEKPIDLFKLQPKKPNWDLKRDVARKMERVDVQTDNAIARLVRERIEGAKKKALERDGEGREQEGMGEEVGLGGEELVEGVHVREREEAEEERREKEDEEMV